MLLRFVSTIFCVSLTYFWVIVPCFARSTVVTDSDAKSSPIPVVFEVTKEVASRRRRIQRLKPKCGNFLRNVMIGRWIKKIPPANAGKKKRRELLQEIKKKEQELDKDMQFVWKNRGIPANPWHSTRLCGFLRAQRPVNVTLTSGTGSTGIWCDPKGPKPCCNNLLAGRCVQAPQGTCNCPRCADVRTMHHAELMEWKPHNRRCRWHQYSASEACDVMENSPVKELYFVGDSFLQSMYLSLLMILTGKPIQGSWKKEPLNADEQAKCSNYGMTYFQDCRSMTESMDDMLFKDVLCGDGRNVTFKAEFRKYYSSKFGPEFRRFVSKLLGKQGTYLVVGIGFHVQMNLKQAVNGFLNPAVRLVKNHYKDKPEVPENQRWPQFLFSQPMDYGILKPTGYLQTHYFTKQQAFEQGMRRYCSRKSIPVLDFTPLTKGVYSFDGIHYGVGVNIAKSQIFLNYLATLLSI